MSISPTFYDQLIHMKFKRADFMYLQFKLICFWCEEIGRKAVRKMLVKLATVCHLQTGCKNFTDDGCEDCRSGERDCGSLECGLQDCCQGKLVLVTHIHLCSKKLDHFYFKILVFVRTINF